jgi:signal transduction histidine kinase
VDRALSLVDDGLRGVRNVLNDLRPGLLDDLGLLPALRSLVAEFGERHGAPVTFTAPESIPVLSDEAEVAVFRAVQEALSNVARHAERAPVRVEVTTPPGHLRLVIADEGPGFDGSAVLDRAANDGHLGIAGMRERIAALGGRVDVRSAAGSGVRIEITLATREDSA